MIRVQEATAIVLSNLYRPRKISVPLNRAVGKVLAEPIIADRDLPPFHRVTMDGIAIAHQVWRQGIKTFEIEGTAAAGEPQHRLSNTRNAVEVMTGAILPEGTDAVIRYEDLRIEGRTATIVCDKVEPLQSIHQQGQDAKKGEELLSPSRILSPSEIALLASVGKQQVEIFGFPKTALVASGDELVEIGAFPLSHQIRRSNTYALEAAMNTMGWEASQHHLRDDKQELKDSLAAILKDNDAIILSGGVSQGKFDFIPAVMEEIGVKKIFHQVSQRPGKPFWFGVSSDGKAVFALPGNPVSTFMCFYRYIRPWVLKSLGVMPKSQKAILACDFSFAPKLTYFLQVSVRNEEGKMMAYPEAGGGSGDFANLKNIDGFLELPMERTEFKAGEAFDYIPFRL